MSVSEFTSAPEIEPGLRRSRLARTLLTLYRGELGLGVIARLIQRLEGGPMHSASIRQLLQERFGVRIGAFSYGACLEPGAFHPGLVVGRYVSMARYVRWGFDHPLDRAFLHPAFYLPQLGIVDQDYGARETLMIGHDAWIGDMVVITPRCRRIGIGAVVGAGSVVTHDVPDFGVAYGAPARLVRKRFDDGTCEALKQSRWWELSPAELRRWRHIAPLTVADPIVRQGLEEIAAYAARRIDRFGGDGRPPA